MAIHNKKLLKDIANTCYRNVKVRKVLYKYKALIGEGQNYIVFNIGKDLFGNPLVSYIADYELIANYGYRPMYIINHFK